MLCGTANIYHGMYFYQDHKLFENKDILKNQMYIIDSHSSKIKSIPNTKSHMKALNGQMYALDFLKSERKYWDFLAINV